MADAGYSEALAQAARDRSLSHGSKMILAGYPVWMGVLALAGSHCYETN